MLDVARDKQVYHELVKAELTAYLQSCAQSFDVIVSADTLVYFGRIDDACTAAAAALRPAGRLIFTLEKRRDDASAADFAIRTHGRYQHDRAYVERVLVAAGLEPQIVSAELRMESGIPVAGLVVSAVKPAAADMDLAHIARQRGAEARAVGDRDA
jgi:predicted TPR repeat methyltransferase